MKKANHLILMFAVCAISCSNPSTPAGYEGYVRQDAMIGSTRFYSTQKGPISTGLGWMLAVDNVDMRWATIDEEFSVLSQDNLNLQFNAHMVIRPKDGAIRELVEVYGGGEWYSRNIRQPFRNAIYEAVAGYMALEAKENREKIAETARLKLLEYIKNKPFEMQAMVVGVINLPTQVTTAQEERIRKQTLLSQKQFEIDIAKQDAVVRVEEARGIAESQKIISQSLTHEYLQHESIKAQEKVAGNPNHSTVYIPVGTNGIPLVATVNPKAEKETIRAGEEK